MAKKVLPIVNNNANFTQAKAGAPVLISWDDAVTMFHEFGHAIHGLLSKVEYPALSGTAVSRDFVEFPSQVNENFCAPARSVEVSCRFKRQTHSKRAVGKN